MGTAKQTCEHDLQALPLFLDRLADPITAVLVSVTVVLIFGISLSLLQSLSCTHSHDSLLQI